MIRYGNFFQFVAPVEGGHASVAARVDLKPGRRPYVSRADVADFLMRQLTDDAFVHKTPAIGY